jgi:hypothetical protein
MERCLKRKMFMYFVIPLISRFYVSHYPDPCYVHKATQIRTVYVET